MRSLPPTHHYLPMPPTQLTLPRPHPTLPQGVAILSEDISSETDGTFYYGYQCASAVYDVMTAGEQLGCWQERKRSALLGWVVGLTVRGSAKHITASRLG